METKSRYQVIAELEERKRQLIQERDSFEEHLIEKEMSLKQHDRKREDTMRVLDREREDIEADIVNFKALMDSKKATVEELITSIDASLEKFQQK